MNRLGLATFIGIVWYHTFFLASACKNIQPEVSLTPVKIDSIYIEYPKVMVYFDVKKDYIENTNSLIFKDWGNDGIKSYVRNYDTLKISWYHNERSIMPEDYVNQLKYRLEFDYLDTCAHSISKFVIGELDGYLCEAVCSNRARIMYFGTNETNHIHVFADFRTTPQNPNFRNDFVNFLKSMQFRPVQNQSSIILKE